ncbi:DMT family transporter [Halioxenophilus aromaticivorans]|uniref:DMT family transporter n=1 Tax=Halioxenophilus aromaticivorans TaxID=1306992 RepID=UPI0031E7F7BF
MKEIQYPELSPQCLLIIVSFLAAIGWLFSKLAMADFDPLLFMALRFIGAAVIFTPLNLRTLGTTNHQTTFAPALVGVVLGVQTSVWAYALAHTNNLGTAGFISCLGPILAAPLASIFKLSGLTRRYLFSLALATAGLVAIFLPKGNGENLTAYDTLFIVSSLLFAIHLNVNHLLIKRWHSSRYDALQMLAAGVTCAGGSLLLNARVGTWSVNIILYLGLSIILCTALRFKLLNLAQHRAPNVNPTLALTLEPVFVAIFAAVLLNQSLSYLQFFGAAIILFAVSLRR